jgi:CRISPR-associated endonuclease/helicase Cas3
MPTADFPAIFSALTGNPPFPWQTALFARFVAGDIPDRCNIPTGLGKTAIAAVWLIALAQHPDRAPRRLVYVVNRRTVVDQTTTEVGRLRDSLKKPELAKVRDALASLCALPLPTPDAPPLAVSTLRGQFADNGEWYTDPSRPAVVVGTVDMIGSGLLFSRYTRGFKTRPLHAGFLAQDTLLVHDEAHLEPSFQELLKTLVATQVASGELRKLRVIELTATSRSAKANAKPFGLDENPDDKDTDNEIVQGRVNAAKKLSLLPVTKVTDGKDKANDCTTVRDKIVELALAKKDSNRAVLIFVRSVESAVTIKDALASTKCAVAPLTGTMRGKERDKLVSHNAVFQRFLPEQDRAWDVTPAPGTVFLVATSAGEVGVNISADDLFCDLSTYESMAQRFGRVNRFGERKINDASEITVVYRENLQASYDEGLEKAKSAKKDADKKVVAYQRRRQADLRVIRTLDLLKTLGDDASPAALDALPADERAAAFSPAPAIRAATEIQFDAWALTSIRQPIAARPPVAPYLHGEAEWQPPETHVAWRKDPDMIDTAELRAAYPPADLLEDFPLNPQELLRETSERIYDRLLNILRTRQSCGTTIPDAWLIPENGSLEVFPLNRLLSDQETDDDDDVGNEEEADEVGDAKKADQARKNRAIALLAGATLILPESLGGIQDGLLTPNAVGDGADVSDISGQRLRVRNATPDVPDDQAAAGFRLIRAIDTKLGEENADDSEETSGRYWLWLEAKAIGGIGARAGRATTETLAEHTAAVVANTAALAAKLLPSASASPAGEPDLRRCLVFAARWHDLGKNRAPWQRNIGNLAYDPGKPESILAKSAPGMRPRNLAEHYRHEFGSLNDAAATDDFASLSDTERDIVLHLVAAHHGRARPHFRSDEVGDFANNTTNPGVDAALATETPRRFARLQKRFGRWGLAWLESLLRAADYAASAGIVAATQSAPAGNATSQSTPPPIAKITAQAVPTATLVVHPANPGHFFACCGLFELAARLSPDVLAWFEQDAATRQWSFHLFNTPPLADILEKIATAKITALDPDDSTASPLEFEGPFNIRLDWWKTSARNTNALKVWAGTMECPRIAWAMQGAVKTATGAVAFVHERLLLDIRIAYEPSKPDNKVEPFYFDANRGPNAHSRDVGFAANDLKLETLAAPAVELLALVGLQRATPAPVPDMARNFDYSLWTRPLPVSLLPAAVNGMLFDSSIVTFRFESWFRTGQRKHKAFITARTVSSR